MIIKEEQTHALWMLRICEVASLKNIHEPKTPYSSNSSLRWAKFVFKEFSMIFWWQSEQILSALKPHQLSIPSCDCFLSTRKLMMQLYNTELILERQINLW